MRRALGLDSPATFRETAAQAGTVRSETSHGAIPFQPDKGSARLKNTPSLRLRLAELERQLVDERAHHDRSRRELEQVQRVLAELHARMQRVALDQADQLTTERQATMRVQRELDDLLFERERHRGAERPPVTAQGRAGDVQAPAGSEQIAVWPEPVTSASISTCKSRGRPPKRVELEPKPVRWWTASYRAQVKKKR